MFSRITRDEFRGTWNLLHSSCTCIGILLPILIIGISFFIGVPNLTQTATIINCTKKYDFGQYDLVSLYQIWCQYLCWRQLYLVNLVFLFHCHKPTNDPQSHTKNQVTLTYFTKLLSHCRKYIDVYYLCKLLTYDHQQLIYIYTVGRLACAPIHL